MDGYITRIRPDLTYLDGRVPGVDVIHLHHAVWANLSRPSNAGFGAELFFAAGEEKSILQLPKGYGYPLKRTDGLWLNHMIHNLTPVPTQVYMVYQIDFVPNGSPAARGMRAVRPIWTDVRKGNLYPVFNVRKGSGRHGRFTYPDDAKSPYRGGPKLNQTVIDRPGVLVGTADAFLRSLLASAVRLRPDHGHLSERDLRLGARPERRLRVAVGGWLR